MADRYNLKNPAVKRILQEVKEMQSNPSDDFMSLPLEENIFEWQFAIKGPRDSEFDGGIYHGRIQLPSEYPFKPPSFMLLTPNGRFETQTKICLSISNHHPEHWQPSWSVQSALVALIAFMPTEPNGALGSLDYKKEERRTLAIKSREAAPKFGTPDRQKIIDEIHEYMLSKAPPVPQSSDSPSQTEGNASAQTKGSALTVIEEQASTHGDEPMNQPTNNEQTQLIPTNYAGNNYTEEQQPFQELQARAYGSQQQQIRRVQRPADDRLFNMAAVGLALAIMVLLVKKFIKSSGHGALFMDGS
ncbi:hypothetical protein SAY87_028174 [Trapa incisa]|uniref:UBC core domain-containing protein n=1 Tax=Trapa incisa TaxID=236973 RepID=A0AAN7L0K0_9MYRT|nr:hypothetical protein SAY87_028174 [Trapa incisa]